MNSLDTLGYCKRLETVGVPRAQAEVHAQILTEVMSQVATKNDLNEAEAAAKEAEAAAKEAEAAAKEAEAAAKEAGAAAKKAEAAVKELEVVTKRESQELEVRLKEWVALYVKEQIAGLKADMLKWFIAISITQASFVIAALRYLPH